MRVTGKAGELRYGYRVVAELGEWELEIQARPTRLVEASAAVRTLDRYWLCERPMTLALDIGAATWIWAGVEPRFDGVNRLRVTTTGRPEVREWAQVRQEVAG